MEHSFDPLKAIHHKVGRAYVAKVSNPPLSLKCMFNGQASYYLGGGRQYIVEDTRFLILNAGTPYTIEKASNTPVETFCIFFPPGMLPTILHGLMTDESSLLASPSPTSLPMHGFFERTYPFPELTMSRIHALRNRSASGSMELLWAEQQIYLLLTDLLQVQERVERQIARLPRTRPATRRELYVRIHWAVDYIHCCSQDQLSLARLAAVAAMSPHHFLRSFRDVVGLSPHEYATRHRLEKACRLLSRTSSSVTEIVGLVGFASLPSFIHLFRNHFGLTPLQYRKKSNSR